MKSLFKRNYKDKITVKLALSFFEKERLIYDYKINNFSVDLVIVTTSGIYLFIINSIKGRIIGSLDDQLWKEEVERVHKETGNKHKDVYSFVNPLINLNGVKKELEKIIDKDFIPIYIYPIFDNLKDRKYKDIYTISTFREDIKGRKRVLTNDEINEYIKVIKEKGTSFRE